MSKKRLVNGHDRPIFTSSSSKVIFFEELNGQFFLLDNWKEFVWDTFKVLEIVSDRSETRNRNHLVREQTLNHLAKLA